MDHMKSIMVLVALNCLREMNPHKYVAGKCDLEYCFGFSFLLFFFSLSTTVTHHDKYLLFRSGLFGAEVGRVLGGGLVPGLLPLYFFLI